MYFEYKEPGLNSIIRLTDNVGLITDDDSLRSGLMHLIINNTDESVKIWVQDVPVNLAPNQLTSCIYLQDVRFEDTTQPLTIISFNRDFYCIMDHDQEVSCHGILFLGTQHVPVLNLDENYQHKLKALLDVFVDEFKTADNVQGEMLKMLLKRLIILCTRLARNQLIEDDFEQSQVDLIRQYNVLVDMHYRSLKQVQDYADLLHKSPKTLSNLFKQYNSKSPLQIIHERIVAEGRRMLRFTDKSAKEIAYDIGFEDPAVFNKLFKKVMNVSPVEYRNTIKA